MSSPLQIAVLGAGNLGLAQAAHLTAIGHRVRLYNRSPARIDPLRGAGLRLRGTLEAEARLDTVTSDLAVAVGAADLIFVDVPASAHADLARGLAEALPPDSSALIALHPGQTFGARHFARVIGLERFPRLALAELQTALYTARSTGPREVTVLAVKRQVALAAYPSQRAPGPWLAALEGLYPQLWRLPSTLHTALMNVQSFIHPAVCVLNLARLQAGERFHIYREGLTAEIAACFEACDAERLTLARALHLEVPTAAEWFGLGYGVDAPTAAAAMRQVTAYETLLAPTSLQTRLLWEDVPTGLVPLVDLARQLDVAVPELGRLLARCQAAVGPAVGQGWTLAALGLGGLDAAGLARAF